jgi:hypothetical protein
MALVVKEDVAANPLNGGWFGTVGVVFELRRARDRAASWEEVA